jgi:hypothetical protein
MRWQSKISLLKSLLKVLRQRDRTDPPNDACIMPFSQLSFPSRLCLRHMIDLLRDFHFRLEAVLDESDAAFDAKQHVLDCLLFSIELDQFFYSLRGQYIVQIYGHSMTTRHCCGCSTDAHKDCNLEQRFAECVYECLCMYKLTYTVHVIVLAPHHRRLEMSSVNAMCSI